MTKKKRRALIVAIIVLVAICSTIIIVEIINWQNRQAQQTAYIKESYYRQNVAFNIAYVYGRSKTTEVYRPYQDIWSEQYLYAYLRLYEHDTGCTVTLDDVWEYLSNEYNEDGSRRLSEQFPKIQAYIDYFCDSLNGYPEKSSYKTDYIALYNTSLLEGLKISCNDENYYIKKASLSDMDKAIEWTFNVSEELKAKGYIYNRDINNIPNRNLKK